MKKILSAVIATLVAMSFTAVVFAADVTVPVPNTVTNATGEVQKKRNVSMTLRHLPGEFSVAHFSSQPVWDH